MNKKTFRIPTKPKTTDSVGYHRQSRQTLATLSKTISTTNQGPDIFTQPKYFEELLETQESKTMTQRCARLVIELVKNISKANPVGRYDQENNIFILDNLGQLSKELDIAPDKLKTAMIGLCSFTYPDFYDNGRGEMVEEYSQIFRVRFIYDKEKLQPKYGTKEIDGVYFLNAPRIGTKQANYIANERAIRIEIIPSLTIVEAINKGTNGGYITTTDDITALSEDLNHTEFSLLTFIGSKRSPYRATMTHIIDELNLTDQVKKQGKPRIVKRLLDGLETLKNKRVVEAYQYDPKTELVNWTQDKNTYDYKGPRKSAKNTKS